MNTIPGILAILLWSSTIAVARRLTEQLGTTTAAAAIYLISGVLGCACLAATGKLSKVRRLPAAYVAGCGALFVLCMVCIYLAVGLAADRTQVIAVVVVNGLWPGLTLTLSVPILKKKARAYLAPGVVVAFAGAVLAAGHAGDVSWTMLLRGFATAWKPYLLAFVAAVSWALYSNLTRRWAASAETGATPLFLLSTGIVMGVLRCFFSEQPVWSARTVMELLYMAVFAALLAYAFWDVTMRKGNIVLVAALSYLTPVLSTLISCLYLGVRPGAGLWIGAALVVVGAVVCKLSIYDRPAEAGAQPCLFRCPRPGDPT